MHTLPIWVWFSFFIIVAGVIAMLYTRGNWRMTLTLVFIALISIFIASEVNNLKDYVSSHFIGRYDALGVPFIVAGPGWSILLDAWLLWLIPVLFGSLLSLGIVKFWQSLGSTKNYRVENSVETEIIPLNSMARQFEASTIKQELGETKQKLTSTIEFAEQQANEKAALAIKLLELEYEQKTTLEDLTDEITALNLQLSAKLNENEILMSKNFEQTEEIIKLKSSLNNLR